MYTGECKVHPTLTYNSELIVNRIIRQPNIRECIRILFVISSILRRGIYLYGILYPENVIAICIWVEIWRLYELCILTFTFLFLFDFIF